MRAAIEVDDGVGHVDGCAGHEGIVQRHGHDQDEDDGHDEKGGQTVPVAQQSQGFLGPQGKQAGHVWLVPQ